MASDLISRSHRQDSCLHMLAAIVVLTHSGCRLALCASQYHHGCLAACNDQHSLILQSWQLLPNLCGFTSFHTGRVCLCHTHNGTASSALCAFSAEDGQLFSWGYPQHGRLGHSLAPSEQQVKHCPFTLALQSGCECAEPAQP